jgi:septal ring factor EnvC (AmiA/AmiB activator)
MSDKVSDVEKEIEKVKAEIKSEIKDVKPKIEKQLEDVDEQLCASGLSDEKKEKLEERQHWLQKRISDLADKENLLRVQENHLRVKEKDLRDKEKNLQKVADAADAERVSGSLFDLNLERTYVCCVTIFANVFLNHVFHRIQRQTHTISAAAAWYHGSPREGQGRATHRFGN